MFMKKPLGIEVSILMSLIILHELYIEHYYHGMGDKMEEDLC